MSFERIYKIILSLCLIFLIEIVIVNFKLMYEIRDKKLQLNSIEEKFKDSNNPPKILGYSDIIKGIGNNESVKIKTFNQQKGGTTATINLYIYADMQKTREILKDIQCKENFIHFNNIKIDKDNTNNRITNVSVDFMKNK